MNSVVSVTPAEKYFSISWRLGLHCNYDCMYCGPQWHNNNGNHHSLDKLQLAWENLYAKSAHLELPYKISFTGGEPTSSKHFLPFITWLRTNYNANIHQLLVTSNGSATYKYYARLLDTGIDNLTLSLHSEHVDEVEFFDTVVQLNKHRLDGKFIHVNIMNEFWNTARIEYYKTLLDTHNVSYSVNEIDYSYRTRTIPIIKGKLNLAIPGSTVL